MVIFIIVPASVSVIVCNAFLWRLLQQAHARGLQDALHTAAAGVEQVLVAEAVRVRTVADLPAAASLAAAAERRDAANTQDDLDLERLWADAARDDLVIRSVLDNDVSEAFRRMRERAPHLVSFVMADSRGRILASTERTDRYFQKDRPWWSTARSAAPGTVVSLGIDANGRAGLAATVIRPGRSNLVDAVIYVEVDLAPRLAEARLTTTRNSLVFVLADHLWPVAGDTSLQGRARDQLAARLRADRSGEGWSHGFRYASRAITGGIVWHKPLRVVAAVAESNLPLAVLVPMAAGIAIGGLAVFGLFYLAMNLGHRLFFDPLREAAEAGVWILRTAYGQAARERSALPAAWADGLGERNSVIQQDLARWLNQWRQELQTQSSTVSVELQRDLDLATEFQQAFLNRPYPRIPEVHVEGRLRLDFYHRYRPALAMGGDFFDIQTLGSDCAGIFVADVMGHGTRSALIVSILRTLISELSRRGRNAPHFVRELNAEFCNMLKTLPHPFFASASYFVCDTTSRMATYAFAGHPPPFYLHRSVGRVTRLEMPKPQGAALGLVPNEEYGGDSVRLHPGDAFIFFTDGVYEAANRRGEEFGLPRLEKTLRAHVYRSSREILDTVMEAITQFVGDQPVADDICLVAVDVTTDPIKPAHHA